MWLPPPRISGYRGWQTPPGLFYSSRINCYRGWKPSPVWTRTYHIWCLPPPRISSYRGWQIPPGLLQRQPTETPSRDDAGLCCVNDKSRSRKGSRPPHRANPVVLFRPKTDKTTYHQRIAFVCSTHMATEWCIPELFCCRPAAVFFYFVFVYIGIGIKASQCWPLMVSVTILQSSSATTCEPCSISGLGRCE